LHYRFLISGVSPVRANIMTYCPFFRNTTETQDMGFANGLPQIFGGLFIYLFTYSTTVGI
jgi:hypothetical protein